MNRLGDLSGIAASHTLWYRSLTRAHWNTLTASNLGWLFDSFETYALILTVGPALRQLLDPARHPQIPAYAGTIIAITLFGWGVGGTVGGILALVPFSFNWASFAVLRFLVGIAIGSEWATGSSMMAEVWPDHARGKGAGLMQCGLGVGFFLASLVWLFVGPLGPDSWRYMYLIGVLPAWLTLWIRCSIPESATWEAAAGRRRAARKRRRDGRALATPEEQLTRFPLFELFNDLGRRRQTVIVFLMSLATTVGFWGISTWVPPFVGAIAASAGLPAARWSSYAGMAYTLGSIMGYVSLGFLADAYGRKPVTIVFFAMALIFTPVLFFSAPRRVAGAGRYQCVLQQRAVRMNAGVAAGTLSDTDARHRGGLCV